MGCYYDRDGITIYHGDSAVIAPGIPGIDAVISDPPYGMAWDTDSTRFSGGGRDDWGDVAADSEPFDPTPWLDYPRVVLWGWNHWALRAPVGTTPVWVKRSDDLFGSFLSDAEIAWMKGGHGIYCFRKQFPPPCRIAESATGEVAHPCQKPVSLMAWCIQKAKVPTGGLILDPFMGSGTTLVAAREMGVRAVGIEMEERYCEAAVQRLRQRVLW